LQRHPPRFPSTGLRDRRRVDVELREILLHYGYADQPVD
jgi:hypothetical protein